MTAHPPYSRLRAAERRVRAAHPDARKVKALWTPASEHEISVEVWHGDGSGASVVVS